MTKWLKWLKWFKYGFCANNSGFGKYLFQLTTLLKPEFICSNNFALFCIDTVTTGTYNLASLIANVPIPVELVITEVDDHVNIKIISQLIKGISRAFQKLVKYLIGAIISISFSLPSIEVLPVIFILDLNDLELATSLSDYLCNIGTNFQMLLYNYHYILWNYILALQHQCLDNYLLQCCWF